MYNLPDYTPYLPTSSCHTRGAYLHIRCRDIDEQQTRDASTSPYHTRTPAYDARTHHRCRIHAARKDCAPARPYHLNSIALPAVVRTFPARLPFLRAGILGEPQYTTFKTGSSDGCHYGLLRARFATFTFAWLHCTYTPACAPPAHLYVACLAVLVGDGWHAPVRRYCYVRLTYLTTYNSLPDTVLPRVVTVTLALQCIRYRPRKTWTSA